MADENSNGDLQVLKILTEDVQAHREYIHKLYRNALWVGGLVIAAGVGFIVFTMGNQLDARILEYRIDEVLKKKVDELTNIKIADATTSIQESADKTKFDAQTEIKSAGDRVKNEARALIDSYTSQVISVNVEKLVSTKLDKLTNEDIPDLIGKIVLPTGFVAAFDRQNGCPGGWSDFTPAAGRFIIGVDGTKFKLPYLAGSPSYQTGGEEFHALTVSEMPRHNHRISTGYSADWHNGLAGGLHTGGIDPVFGSKNPEVRRDGGFGILDRILEPSGDSQPHNNMPPYIALYFCKKD